MKYTLVLLIWLLAALTPGALAASKKPADESETELTGHMEDLNRAYRRLGRQIKDASKNASSLELAAVIRVSAEKSSQLVPAMAEDLPPAERPKFIADYQAAMKVFIEDVGKLETALKASDNAAAAKVMDALKAQQRQGHKAHKRPD